MEWVPLITAFGIGSIVSTVVQTVLAQRGQKKQRSFDERKAAYIGLLEAYHRAAVESSDEAAKNFAFWQMRCEIVGPTNIRKAIAGIMATNDDPSGRTIAHENLKDAMRQDLGVSR